MIHDTSNHGSLTVSQALQKSSNVALAKLALNLPAETIWNKYREYGIGRAPELTFPGVASGRLRGYKRWRPIEQATMAYGYGLSMSLLQIAQTYTAYAGDGTLHPVSLLKNGTDQQTIDAHRGHRVTSPQTAAAIRSMLEMAVGEGGTGAARASTATGSAARRVPRASRSARPTRRASTARCSPGWRR